MKNLRSTAYITNSEPAKQWAEAYPLGNGRIGAMISGDPKKEQISLNHDLLWRSYLTQPTYGTSKDMDMIKELCSKKRWKEANDVLSKTMPSRNAVYINPFVPACDIFIKMRHPSENIESYERMLDMENGTVSIEYKSDGICYTRESFCPVGEELFVMRLNTSLPGMLTGEVSLSRIPDAECTVTSTQEFGILTVTGTFDEGKTFSAAVKIIHRNGRLVFGKKTYGIENEPKPQREFGLGYVFDRDLHTEPERGMSLFFDSCDEVILIATVAVDRETDNTAYICRERLNKFRDLSRLQSDHKKAFSELFNRTRLYISDKNNSSAEKMISELRNSKKISAELLEALYNSARYVAISSGLPQKRNAYPKAPINLQGLWNRDTRPAWESDYHLDLNIEMCYWALASAGLSEFYEPYIQWAERILPQAKKCAKDLYGCKKGAAFNGCCDPWTMGSTDTVGAGWLGAGAWICQILWIYYEHSPSKELLSRIFNIMNPVAEFLEEMLIESESGLTFPFGSSPEMGHVSEGKTIWLSAASSCDLSLAKELFTNLSYVAGVLGKYGISQKYKTLSKNIRPLPTDKNGCLMEWTENHKEAEPGHRHRSPFVCFCPGTSVTRRKTPETVSAMEKLLDRRLSAGNGMSTAFSYSWDAHIMARLNRGDEALDLISNLAYIHILPNLLLTTNDGDGIGGGISWFKGVKLMQVEAHIALIAGITEFFLQDTDRVLTPLPSLPKALPQGKMLGIHTRRGFTVDISWTGGKLKTMTLTSVRGNIAHIVLPSNVKLKEDSLPPNSRIENGILSFPTEKDTCYNLIFE